MALAGGVWWLNRPTEPVARPAAVAEAPGYRAVSVGGINYEYVTAAADPKKISLIGNFDQPAASADLATASGCAAGVNGGFYGQDGQPLGWWEANGQVYKNYTHNNLLNGYAGVNEAGSLVIGSGEPRGKWRWGLQSGPLLVQDGKALALVMAADKPARRSVLAKTRPGTGELIMIFGDRSALDGPVLAELPMIIEAIGRQEGWQITEAINLDGGTAAAFYSPEVKIPEVVAVGSWICAGN